MTFLRDDINCTFKKGDVARPAYAIYLKALESLVTLPKDLSARVAQDKHILSSGPPRTFLKPGKDMTFIPSAKSDRVRDAPNTVFVRCLYVSKEKVDEDTQELLQKSCKQIIGTTPACNYAKVVNVLSTGKKRRRDEFLSDQELDDGMCFRLP